jgi:hypothetical protein
VTYHVGEASQALGAFVTAEELGITAELVIDEELATTEELRMTGELVAAADEVGMTELLELGEADTHSATVSVTLVPPLNVPVPDLPAAPLYSMQ